MAILSLSKIPELNHRLEKYGYKIHVHDACGGQSFSLEATAENTDNRVLDFLEDYFSSENMKITFFGKDKLNFIAK